MRTRIYLVRHAESKANEKNVFIGHTDLDITEKGKQQAMKAAEFLKDIPVDVIYSSDLMRAYHTAEYTAKAKGLDVIPNKNLREVYAGDWENLSFKELAEQYRETFGRWVYDIGLAGCDNGETVQELQNRIMDEIEALAKKHDGESIMIFTHATPIRVFKAAADGIAPEEMKNIPWVSNASVTSAEYEDGKFRMLEYSRDDFMGEICTALPNRV